MKNTGWLYFILLLTFGSFGYFFTRAEIYYRLIIFGFALVGISYVWSQISLDGIVITVRNRANKAKVGQVFDETTKITNHSRLPKLFLEVNDASDLFFNTGSRLITWIGPGQTRSVTTRIKLSKRGFFSVGSKLLRSGDPIGFFVKEKMILLNLKLLVLPHFYTIQIKDSAPQIIKNGKSIQKRSLDPSVQFSEVRNYSPGDDYKRIHWLSSKKLNKLMVKEFEQYLHNEYWILLDSSEQGWFFKESSADSTDPWVFVKKEKVQLPKDSFEYGVTIAATISHQLLRMDRAVGFISESRGNIAIPLDSGFRQEKKIFENLALISPKGKKAMETVITQNSRSFAPGSIVLIITSLNDDSLLNGISALLEKKITPLIFLLDRTTFGTNASEHKPPSRLAKLKVPVCQIQYNSDLKGTIESFLNSNLTG